MKWVCGFVWFRNIWWLARKYIKNENNLEECEIEYEKYENIGIRINYRKKIVESKVLFREVYKEGFIIYIDELKSYKERIVKWMGVVYYGW